MTEAAVELGADVPFSLMGETAIGLGRGEKLTLVDQVAPLHWVLVVADRGLSTPAVYKRLDELRAARGEDPTKVNEAAVPAEFISAIQSGDVSRVAKAIKNDLQEAALDLMPELADTIAAGIADAESQIRKKTTGCFISPPRRSRRPGPAAVHRRAGCRNHARQGGVPQRELRQCPALDGRRYVGQQARRRGLLLHH